MNGLTDFQYQDDSSFVGWVYDGNIIKKNYLSKIYALLLKSKRRVLIIELKREKDNAIILNADGSEFCRIKNPDPQAICFGDAYYINDELTLISRRSDASMLGVVIDEDGNLIRVYETR